MDNNQLVELVVREVARKLAEQRGGEKRRVLVLGDPAKLDPQIAATACVSTLEDYCRDGCIKPYESVYILKLTSAQLCDIALGRDCDPMTRAVQGALLTGIKVYLCEAALTWRRYRQTAPPKLLARLEEYYHTIVEYGVIPLSAADTQPENPSAERGYDCAEKLITESVAARLCKSGKTPLAFRKGAILTALAKDAFRAAGIEYTVGTKGGGAE